jgi:hypothetical protein
MAAPGSESRQPETAQARAERIYEAEEIIHKASMTDSDYRLTLVALVRDELLSQRCKMALYAVIYMAFDKNVVLANNADIELRILRLKEALNKAKLSYTRPDVMNPAIVYIHETIEQHFRDFSSRSFRMGERIMQGERKIVQESRLGESTPTANAQQGVPSQEERGYNLRGLLRR